MKRFTETDKWQDDWFLDLEPAHKLAWMFICDTCDNVGVWDCSRKLSAFQMGQEIDWDAFREAAGKRIVVMPNGKWWIRAFCRFQHPDLSEDSKSNAVQSHVRKLKEHGLWQHYANPSEGSGSPSEPFRSPSEGSGSPSLPLGSPPQPLPKGPKDPQGEGEGEGIGKGSGGECREGAAPPGRRPPNLKTCLARASMIGLEEGDARGWYRDQEAAGWIRGDGTPVDNWVVSMTRYRDVLRDRRARFGHDKVTTQSQSDKRLAELNRNAAAL